MIPQWHRASSTIYSLHEIADDLGRPVLCNKVTISVMFCRTVPTGEREDIAERIKDALNERDVLAATAQQIALGIGGGK